jgi:hypothetical protein
MQKREINVLEMAKGAILEQIEGETTKIMSNILDPNTDPKKARKMTITLTFKANEGREVVVCEAQAKSNLAPIRAIETSFYVGEDKDGQPIAQEVTKFDPNQETMFVDEDEKVTNVLKLTMSVNQ